MYDIIVIGAGAVGGFVARELSKYEGSFLLLDAENDVGNVTSMANSAIVHSGYDPVPGTKKARFNVEGNRMYKQVCDELNVAFEEVGSLTVALDQSQMDTLIELQKRGNENGVETRLIGKEELHLMEPNINPDAVGALLCPTAGVVDPFNLVAHACENACDNGVELKLNQKVVSIAKNSDAYVVKTETDEFEAKVVINCAGLHCDDIAKMIEPIDWTITPRKGEYILLDHFAYGMVKHVLFPLPSEKGKGILVSMTSSWNYFAGPTSEPTSSKEDLSTDTVTLADIKRQASLLVPSVPWGQQIRTFSGVRATPSTHDFIIEPSKKHADFINVAGIESPGLVSSPAIGKYVVESLVSKVFDLKAKENWNPRVRPYPQPRWLSLEECNELFKQDPDYATIVCQCERVTLGEIKDVLKRSIPCNSVKAMKKRTRAGMGKCQGGFCQPIVATLLSRGQMTKALYDGKGSNLLLKESK